MPRLVLITMNKTFLRPYIDYGKIVYDEAYNKTFHQNFESFQYNACLALSGSAGGSSRKKLYHELGLEHLQRCDWFRDLYLFIKFSKKINIYHFNLIPTKNSNGNTRIQIKLLYFIQYIIFSKIFFLSTIIEWKKLDPYF